jgi:predicted Zn-dependent protease
VALDIESKDPDAAYARIATLKKARPLDAAAFVLEGDVDAATQRLPAASAAYARAYELTPSLAIALRDLRARTVGSLPKSTQLVERWLAAHPEDHTARTALAESALQRREYRQATVHYQALLDARPGDVVTMNNLAWLYHELGDKRGLPLAREAVMRAPQSAAVNDTLGWMLVESGSAAEGLRYLQAAASSKDANPEIRYHHAVALSRTGSVAEARRALENLLQTPQFASRAAAEKLLQELSAGASGGS